MESADRRGVLWRLGITPEGKKEVIDFTIVPGESREAWERFLTDLYRRGLQEKELEMVVVDGGCQKFSVNAGHG